MNRITVYLLSALFTLPLLAAAAPSLAIYVDFESQPASSAFRLMRAEVERLIKPAGVEVNWRKLADNRGLEAFGRVVVLRFKGSCGTAAQSVEPAGGSSVLALSKVLKGRVLPFGEIECDQVRNALSYLNPEAGIVERQMALGLALGRVVAHELYHMLAQTTTHAKSGLARASQSLPDLISRRKLSFSGGDSQAIAQGFK
jgi:hypothetical protein